MSLVAALWLQADDLGTKGRQHTPGSESLFSRVVIALFVVSLVIAIAVGIYMVFQGCKGTLRHRKGKS